MRRIFQSAAYRIAILSALAFALATVVIGLAVLYAVHTAFERQLEGSIKQASANLSGEYNAEGANGLAEAITMRERSASNDLGFAVFTPDGRRIGGSLDTPMPPLGWHRIIFLDPMEGADPARALITQLPNGNRLVIAADLEPIEAMDGTILIVFGFGFLGILAIGTVLAFVLGSYLKRRLDCIAKVSHAFAGGDLAGRAEVGPRHDEFDQLAASLNAMLDRIAALLRNLQQVTSDLAHDMRTPLSHLRSDLERLRDSPEADRAEMIEIAIEKSDEILQLFAAILRISELEQADLRRHFQQLDLGALVRDLGETHEPLAEDSGHDLVVIADAVVRVDGDRELLAQALINLLQNCLRHTPEGSRIELGTCVDAGHPVLFVRDNGPGIPEGDRQRVLGRFVRLETARSTPGNGLGLSLAKAIADAHGARFELRDAGPGLEVRIVFAGGTP